MENRTRNKRLQLRLTEKEWAQLQKKCSRCHLKPQAYILKLISEILPREFPPMEYFEILRNLRQINLNMNQIAVKANASGIVDVKAYWENVGRLQEIYNLLKY